MGVTEIMLDYEQNHTHKQVSRPSHGRDSRASSLQGCIHGVSDYLFMWMVLTKDS